MSDNWDFYFCHIEGKPAANFVDLGIEAPQSDKPFVAYMRVFLSRRGADGLPAPDEFDLLVDIEEFLIGVAAKRDAVYVGRSTTDGTRCFIFYTSDGDLLARHIERAFATFNDYRFETDWGRDAEWKVYKDFLYPDPRALRVIAYRRLHNAHAEENAATLKAETDLEAE